MDLRRLQLTGGASYSVTLPKAWVQGQKLAAGDPIGIEAQADGSLVLSPRAKRAPARTRFEVEATQASGESTFRRIVAAYLAGHDTIVVKGKRPLSPAVRKAVRASARRIVGVEVVEEEPNAITLQDFMDPGEFQIAKGLRRMEALTRAIQEDALAGAPLEDAEERDDEVDKLYWMVNKQYHAILRDPLYGERMQVNAAQALNYLLVARLIERSADHARHIAEHLAALRGGPAVERVESKLERHARRAVDLFGRSLAAFHARDAHAADRIIDEAREFTTSQAAVAKEALSLGGENILHVAYALDSVARTAAYAADIAETAINHQVATSG